MEGYLGVIEALGFSFVPRNYGACFGGLIAISQNSALFSLIGTFFGGDGRNTFGLPDLRGRIPMGYGTGIGLTPRTMGQKVGQEEVTLVPANLPSHTHTHTYAGSGAGGSAASLTVAATGGKKQTPDDGDYIAAPASGLGAITANMYIAPGDIPAGQTATCGGVSGGGGGFDNTQLTIHNTGNSSPFPVTQPSQAVNFCICTQGTYPTRS